MINAKSFSGLMFCRGGGIIYDDYMNPTQAVLQHLSAIKMRYICVVLSTQVPISLLRRLVLRIEIKSNRQDYLVSSTELGGGGGMLLSSRYILKNAYNNFNDLHFLLTGSNFNCQR